MNSKILLKSSAYLPCVKWIMRSGAHVKENEQVKIRRF